MSASRANGLEERTANAFGRLLHEAGDQARQLPDATELERLLRAADAGPSDVRRAPRAVPWIAAAAAVLIAVAFFWVRHTDASLTFDVDGAAHAAGDAIAADHGHSVDVNFSDGTSFDVEPGARLRVQTRSANGAHLVLMEGRAVARVVHRSRSSWSVAAGPFEVRDTGTRFGASWDPVRRRLTVELYEGSVQVAGGGFATPIAVHAGQRLEAGSGSGDWALTPLEKAPPSPASSASPVEPAPSATPSDVAPSKPVTPLRNPASADWPALLARADFDGILRRANDIGIDRCLASCPPSDLRILADSARYLGRFAVAEQALGALRRRSPSDGPAAAFLLGRLDESRDAESALSWYERSLSEAPNGTYAAEAWGGKLRMLLQLRGPEGARAAARAYLVRFPNGVRAALARQILATTDDPSPSP